jgi:hypothetical protein
VVADRIVAHGAITANITLDLSHRPHEAFDKKIRSREYLVRRYLYRSLTGAVRSWLKHVRPQTNTKGFRDSRCEYSLHSFHVLPRITGISKSTVKPRDEHSDNSPRATIIVLVALDTSSIKPPSTELGYASTPAVQFRADLPSLLLHHHREHTSCRL